MSCPTYTSSSNAFAIFGAAKFGPGSETLPSFGSFFSFDFAFSITAPPTAICKAERAAAECYSFDSNSKFETSAPPPEYQECSTAPKRSLIASFFTRRRRSSSPSPPPYVSAEELELIEARLSQLDAFFGGSPL